MNYILSQVVNLLRRGVVNLNRHEVVRFNRRGVVNLTGACRQNYSNGYLADTTVYDGSLHAILIIGWNDSFKCWLVKNSWGTNWGQTCPENGYLSNERGFIWIGYKDGNVGLGAMWIDPMKSEDKE